MRKRKTRAGWEPNGASSLNRCVEKPVGDKSKHAASEEKTIQDILLNIPSKQLVRAHSKELDNYLKAFIKDNKSWSLTCVEC